MRDWSELGYIIDPTIWYPPKKFAKHIGCGIQTLYNKKSSGELPEDNIVTDGRRWYIHKDTQLPFTPRAPKKVVE